LICPGRGQRPLAVMGVRYARSKYIASFLGGNLALQVALTFRLDLMPDLAVSQNGEKAGSTDEIACKRW
jgi:hypothetical protein